MICKSCNFENREGAAFCAECGKPLQEEKASDMKPMESSEDKTVLIDPMMTENKKPADKEDDSEENTTVLTSNMVNNQPKQAGPAPIQPMSPMGPGMVQPQQPGMAPQMNPQQPGQAPMGQVPQMQPQQPGQAPMGQAPQMKPQQPGQAPMGQAPQMKPQQPGMAPMGQAPQMKPQQPGPAPMGQMPQQPKAQVEPSKKDKKEKKEKAPKQPKVKKEKKMGVGTKVYIVLSILLILGLTGVGVWGYFHYEDKLEKAQTDKETMIAEYDDKIAVKDGEIAQLNASASDAQAQIMSLQAEVDNYELSLAESQAAANSYAVYDSLIQFANGCTGGASTELFVSDTVLHLTQGADATVQVYFPIAEGVLEYKSSDETVANCVWGEEWVNGNVLDLTVKPIGSGNATITISNDQNDIVDIIYVYVE